MFNIRSRLFRGTIPSTLFRGRQSVNTNVWVWGNEKHDSIAVIFNNKTHYIKYNVCELPCAIISISISRQGKSTVQAL